MKLGPSIYCIADAQKVFKVRGQS